MTIATTNPATGDVLERFEPLTADALDRCLLRAHAASLLYRATSFRERAGFMMRAASVLGDSRESFARLMTTEMGKPIAASRAEVDKCAWVCRYYAENAQRFLAPGETATSARRSWVAYQPLGVVLAVMPWNFPFWQVFRFAAPALMAGNVGLLKHASNVPGCALAIERIFRQSGLPHGVFQSLLIGNEQVAELIADSRVAAVTLTGSEEAGQAVGSSAGRALKKSVLELGGSDPFIVMPSAELEEAAEIAVKARTLNAGQSCIAAKRFIIHEQVADVFQRLFVERMKALQVGDPMDEETDVGPLATAEIAEELERQVRESVSAGARLLLGGERRAGPGYYFEPTVLVDAPPDAPARREELFGPVAAIIRVRDVEEAIRVANETRYGLGASAWTSDPAEQSRFTTELEAGMVFINAMVASDPRVPFGGIKRSGYGRELGVHGIREFVNIKTVWVGGGAAGAVPAAE
jgi:succinate-semialdehyde dehydrogenase / glutarate-semialdehyde dehydrogenase